MLRDILRQTCGPSSVRYLGEAVDSSLDIELYKQRPFRRLP